MIEAKSFAGHLGNLERILYCYENLSEVEKEVLSEFAHRLYQGQRMYGKLTTGKKKWAREGYEEALDMAVYSAVGLLEIDKGIKK